ncbi:tyrosinase family protein [Entomohabitans teleogrylli]|uniref:tyrosinase family protein n=1 Tax=Entomohabitans teleogrylli TaxID=1384589 RepID=UPI001379ABCA|nr:tyrosinase family protein [Entomohabitans teleogrylli]
MPTNNTLTRYSVSSSEGKAMLEIYAKAVAKMMDTSLYPQGNPLNWEFQWYTHFVRGDRTKAGEISRIYPSASYDKELADKMWDTCQAHSGQREDFFLPWHRMFVAFFENIIRQVSGEAQFTLPWWDYTDPAQQSIPEAFRRPGDALWGSLYRKDRWDNTNQGHNITEGPGGAALTLDCMKSNFYSATASDAGFCANLDNNPHGALHVDVGNRRGMASVPWAASDPVFWVHHANVDRIWASWNQAGGKNPDDDAFKNATFVFASAEGKADVVKVADYLSVPQSAYSHYAERPAGSIPFTGQTQVMAKKLALVASAPQVTLGDKSTTLALNPEGGSVTLFSDNLLEKQTSSARVFLRFEGLSAHDVVNGSYNVFVHGSAVGDLSTSSPSFVGQVNFFGVPGSHHHDGEDNATELTSQPKMYSILLNEKTLAMLAVEKITTPQITLSPTAKGNDAAMPMIEKIKFVIE